MKDVFWDYFKPQRDEERRNDLYDYVRTGDMKIENAARRAGISVDQFRQQMEEYNRSQNLQPV